MATLTFGETSVRGGHLLDMIDHQNFHGAVPQFCLHPKRFEGLVILSDVFRSEE